MLSKRIKIKPIGLSVVLICFFLLVFSFGCAQTRYIKNRTPPPNLGLKMKKSSFELVINHIITPNGPGSWVKDAPWVEYVVTARNLSKKINISVLKFSIIDFRGVYVNSGVNPSQLQKKSEELMEHYKAIGISGAITVAPSVLGSVALSAGSLTAAGAAVALAPVALLAGPASLGYYWLKRTKDRENILAEFNKRRFPEGVILSLGGQVVGSVFFPLIHNPKALVVEIRRGSANIESLKISLEASSYQPETSLVGSSSPPPLPKVVYVLVGTANIRSGPGKQYAVIANACRGDVLSVIGQEGRWYKVRLENEVEGWIAKWITSVDKLTNP